MVNARRRITKMVPGSMLNTWGGALNENLEIIQENHDTLLISLKAKAAEPPAHPVLMGLAAAAVVSNRNETVSRKSFFNLFRRK